MEAPTLPSSAPPTPIYVLIPPSPLFAAHWSLFLPDLGDYDPKTRKYREFKTGRRIHVSGDRLNGFRLEIVRQYDLSKHRSVGTRMFAIGVIPPEYLSSREHTEKQNDNFDSRRLHKDEDEGGGYIDNHPFDAVERVCVAIEAPGPSLNPVAKSATSHGKREVREIRDCQWWVRQVLKALVEKEMLVPRTGSGSENDVLSIVATLPMH